MMSQVMKATEVRIHFGEVLRRVSGGKGPIIVEKAGQPAAAIISVAEYRWLEQLKAGRDPLAVLARARASRQRIRAERGEKPLPDAVEILRQIREERSEQISGVR